MSDEQLQEATQTANNDGLEKLKRSIEGLERKNFELIGKLKEQKEKAVPVPEGVDVQELLDFKRKKEQEELESKGKYDEALKQYAQQFQEREEGYKRRIAELESKLTVNQLDNRVVAILAEQGAHNPHDALRLVRDQLKLDDSGNPVAVDGYNEIPMDQWVERLKNERGYLFKAPAIKGSGAPVGVRTSSNDVPLGTKNPFTREHFNLTEQSRLYRTDRDLYERLKASANNA
jgi:hypothetical protein